MSASQKPIDFQTRVSRDAFTPVKAGFLFASLERGRWVFTSETKAKFVDLGLAESRIARQKELIELRSRNAGRAEHLVDLPAMVGLVDE